MLQSLHVLNFALIEQVSLEFSSGLTVLTGETGAGKSIIIDSLSVVLGGRASTDAIRSGCEFFRVEAVFSLPSGHPVFQVMDSHGITQVEETIILSRRVNKNGKNTIVINGCQAPVTVLKKVGDLLVDMYGQHDNQALLRPEYHLSLLDNSDLAIMSELKMYRQTFQEWQFVTKSLAHLRQSSRDREQRIDILTWQTKEIAAAELKSGEEEKIEAELKVLSNAEKISKAAEKAYHLFQMGSKGASGVLEALSDIRKELETIHRYDDSVEGMLQIVNDTWYQLEEVASEISDYGESVEYNPKRLAKLQDRLDVIDKLKRKYGATIAEILAYYEQTAAELDTISMSGEKTADLEERQSRLEQNLTTMAGRLDHLRRTAGNRLSGEIGRHLAELAIPQAKFIFEISTSTEFGPNGCNQIQLLFSANPGEEPKPLNKIASGGELSRVALAIKTITSCHDVVGTMIFDEVDAGIGGQTAQMVAEKITLVSMDKQVLAVTHLPQMACMADTHYYISKHSEDGRTFTTVVLLQEEERVQEITKMMTGQTATPLALESTAHLLSAAKEKKESWKKTAQQ